MFYRDASICTRIVNIRTQTSEEKKAAFQILSYLHTYFFFFINSILLEKWKYEGVVTRKRKMIIMRIENAFSTCIYRSFTKD